MSKWQDSIERAIFYANQNPTLLFDYLKDLIPNPPTSITMYGSTTIENDSTSGSEHKGYSAKAFNKFGDPLPTAVSIALKSAVTGVTYSSGKVTLTSAVADGTEFTLKATISDSTVIAEMKVTVSVPSSGD